MEPSLSRITKHIYLSNVFATDVDFLRTCGVDFKHIISVGIKPHPTVTSSLYFDVMDDEMDVKRMEDEVLPVTYDFLVDKVGKGENVLVHCAAGRSRSATVVIYYLMKRCGLTFEEAHAVVAKFRPEITLNKSFAALLKKF